MADAFAAALAKVDAPETSTAAVSQTATSTEAAPVVAEAEVTAPTEAAPAADAPLVTEATADPDAQVFKDLAKSNLSQAAKDRAFAALKRDKEFQEHGWKPEDLRELKELEVTKDEILEYRANFQSREDVQRTTALANDLNRLLTEFETQPAQFVGNLLKTAEQSGNIQAFDAVYNVFQKDILTPQNPAAVAFFERCARNFFTNHLNGQDADRAEAAKIFLEKDFAQPAQADPVIARREAELADRERRFNEERQQLIQNADHAFKASTEERAGSIITERATSLIAEKTKGWSPVVVEEVTKAVLTGTVNQILGDKPFIESMERYRKANGNTAQTQEFILGQVKTKAERAAALHTNNAVKKWNGYGVAPQATAAPTAPPHREPSATNITSGAKPVEKPLNFSTREAAKDSIWQTFQRIAAGKA